MIRADSHCHSTCSPDGISTPSEMITAACKAGLDTFYLTEHCECTGFLLSDFTRTHIYMEDAVKTARREISSMKFPVSLPFGVEVGQALEVPEVARRIIGDYNFDFILASLHNMIGYDDFALIKYSSYGECDDYFRRYLTELRNTAEYADYDSLAHLEYPLRYFHLSGFTLTLEDYEKELREVLRIVVGRGKAIELNTASLRKGYPYLSGFALSLYRELGGKYVTVGSDAHKASDIACDFDRAEKQLRDSGFGYYTIYKERKPIAVEL